MIRYVPHNEIDKERYDNCIQLAANTLIYAYSWYLDIVAPGWDLLEYDNYEAVMPLPRRRRFGISYVFTPRYVQQLGIFGKDVTTKLGADFLVNIPRKFRLVDLKFNEQNVFDDSVIMKKRTNFLLDLTTDYVTITKSYNRNCTRNIRKAVNAGLKMDTEITAEEFAGFIGKNLTHQVEGLSDTDITLLAKLTGECLHRQAGDIICVRDAQGHINAAGSFLFSGDRLIFTVCASSPEGHRQQAMYFLVDHQINKYAGTFSLFDFSGSEIKGIAYFNSGFGARSISYPFLQINRLPVPIKLLAGKI